MDKKFLTYNMEINGLWQEVKFSEYAIEEIFMPFLQELTDLKMTMDRKVIAYLVAVFGKTQSRTLQRSRSRSCARHGRLSLHGGLHEYHGD